jgi:hypothetical protein
LCLPAVPGLWFAWKEGYQAGEKKKDKVQRALYRQMGVRVGHWASSAVAWYVPLKFTWYVVLAVYPSSQRDTAADIG